METPTLRDLRHRLFLGALKGDLATQEAVDRIGVFFRGEAAMGYACADRLVRYFFENHNWDEARTAAQSIEGLAAMLPKPKEDEDTFLIAKLCAMFGVQNDTLGKAIEQAGLERAAPGDREYRYSKADARKIAEVRLKVGNKNGRLAAQKAIEGPLA